MFHMSISLPKKVRRKPVTLLSREEYAGLAMLLADMIKIRTRVYNLDAKGKPFKPYSASYLRHKKPVSDDQSPWADLKVILDKITERYERRETTAPEHVKAAFRAQIAHFWHEINQKKMTYYEELAQQTAVDLTKSGELLNQLSQSSSKQKARVYADKSYAKWLAVGTKPQDRTDPETGKSYHRDRMPARPFMGVTSKELEWILEEYVQPFIDFLQLELGKVLFGTPARDVRPNPMQVTRKAWVKRPDEHEEAMSAEI